MVRITYRNLVAHKRRLLGTFLAIVIGVAFFSGVTALTATINQTFDDLFSNGNKGTDAFVRSSSKIEVSQGPGTFTLRGRIDASLIDQVRAVDGVKAAEPFIQGSGRIVTSSGKALGNPDNGPPVFAEAWINNPRLTGWSIAEGRAPAADGEVVIDRQVAKDGDVHVGDHVTVQSRITIPATVVGIATYAGEDSSGGTTLAAFTAEQAARDVVGDPGKVDGIKVVAADGVSQQEIVQRLQAVMPAGTETITGAALVKELQDDIQKQFLGFFNILFGVFAGVAVVVAVFSIYNTFSIIVAQRTREMALLRAIGAGRTQLLQSVLIEAVVVGLIASAIGVFAGAGLALALRSIMHAAGFGLPASTFVFGPGIIIEGIVVGVIVSVIAGLIPAVRATRIPPLAALRSVAVEQTKPSKVRIGIGLVAAAIGLANLLSAAFGSGDNRAAMAGLGTLFLLIGFVVLGPVVARPTSRMLGLPLPRLRGVTGHLARENAMRNPRRTAGSAMALMIGVAVVALFTIFAASIKATIDGQIAKQFAGDLVVGSGFSNIGVTPTLASELAKQPQVEAVSGLRFGVVQIDGKSKEVRAGDPSSLAKVLKANVKSGSLSDIDATHMAVADDIAEEHHWSVGSTITVHFVDGSDAPFQVAAVYEKARILGGYLLSVETLQTHYPDSTDALVAIKVKDGVSASDAKAALKPLVDSMARGSSFLTRQEFADEQAGQINQFLTFVYIMLLVAIIISLMGIANTLALSITERTREIGLSRAVGMERKQLRSMIRWEGALIALFGTVGGLGLGTIASWSIVQAAGEAGLRYRLPVGSLIVLVIAGGLAGIVSATFPARRAARMDVLEAIAFE